jgi:polyphenol oxidase
MLADCVPVILYDPVNHAVGVAHSGWKGTVCAVVTNTVLKMGEAFGTDPRALIAGIRHSIGPERYEVGPEVVTQVEQTFPGANVLRHLDEGKGLFDLWEANKYQLLRLGVPVDSIEVAGICSYDNSDIFFSDRRQRPTGRFMTAAMLQ